MLRQELNVDMRPEVSVTKSGGWAVFVDQATVSRCFAQSHSPMDPQLDRCRPMLPEQPTSLLGGRSPLKKVSNAYRSPCPTVIPIPPPAYGGTERVVALQAAGLAAAGYEVTLVAAPGSAIPGVEVVSPLDRVPTQIGMATDEWRHVLGGLDALSAVDTVIDHSGPLGALLSAQGAVPALHVVHGSLEGELLGLYNGLYARAPRCG